MPRSTRLNPGNFFASVFRVLDISRRFRFKNRIYRIAINQARNRWRWWRRRKRDATVSLDSENPHGNQRLIDSLKSEHDASPEQETLAHERERALRKALRSLSHSYRETVILRDIEGFTYEEIAETLGINVGTVKSRLARGRHELRQRLEGSL